MTSMPAACRALRILSMVLLLPLCGAGTAFAWSFAVCGDSRDDPGGVFPRILAEIGASDMELLVHTGDIENTGGVERWKAFRERTKEFRKPLRLVIGNHELYGGGTRETFRTFFGLSSTSYSFTHRDAHFAIVDNAGGSLSGETLRWLDTDLEAHPKGRNGIAFIVVAMHIPPRTDGMYPHGVASGYAGQSDALFEILKRRKADLVLAGHEHMQSVEDHDGIRIIISGGAGARMIPFHRFGYYRVDLEGGAVRETFIPVRKGTISRNN